ncbi:MAG: hypothetical protein JWR49_3788 [Tardiphaga sp.]|nr:hypothetical protein [Tardiphaga sp.]
MNNHALLEAQYALLVLRQAKISSREVAIKLLPDLARQSEYFGSGTPVIAIECGAAAAIRALAREIRPAADAPRSALAKRFRNSGEMEKDFRIEISPHLLLIVEELSLRCRGMVPFSS